jgi:hypothetical protein
MPTISKYVDIDVDVDLSDFADSDLIEELANRNISHGNIQELLETIYHKRRLSQNFDKELDELIYSVIGRI